MPHMYIAPWEWHVDATGFAFWKAPGQDITGIFDLRSMTKSSIPNDPSPGYGLFAYDRPVAIPCSMALGQDPQAQTTLIQRSFIEDNLGVTLDPDSIVETFRQLVLDPAKYDPTGVTGKKPARGSRRAAEPAAGRESRATAVRPSVGRPPAVDRTGLYRTASTRRNGHNDRLTGIPTTRAPW